MSRLLDSLLDTARRADCALHDAVAANLAFSVIPPQETPMKHSHPIVFRPAVQRTAKEGRRTFPLPLHREATPEAQRGWTRKAVDAFRGHLLAHPHMHIETALWR